MACPGYQPAYGVGQLDGSTYEGLNCTCWSAGKAADDDSCGAKKPSSSSIRIWTGDKSGGTNLAQVDDALRTHVGIDLDTRYRYPWAEFTRRVQGGASAILQGWYAVIRDSPYSGSETFGGNHAVLVTPGLVVMDPLADGRRAGIYRYHGEQYPESLLRTFAARLNVGGSTYKPLGDGLVYAAFSRDNEPDVYRCSIHPAPGTKGYPNYRYYNYFAVANGVITGLPKVGRTAGFSANCTAPRLYRWPGHSSQSLVRITSGSVAGRYVRSSWAKGV